MEKENLSNLQHTDVDLGERVTWKDHGTYNRHTRKDLIEHWLYGHEWTLMNEWMNNISK